MTTTFKIVDTKTGEVVHEVRTDKTESQLEKVRSGLERKVDAARFHIEEIDT